MSSIEDCFRECLCIEVSMMSTVRKIAENTKKLYCQCHSNFYAKTFSKAFSIKPGAAPIYNHQGFFGHLEKYFMRKRP